MPLRFEETMQCGLKIIWSKVGITAASKYTEPKKKKKKKSLQDHTKINSYREKKQCTSPYVNMASNLTAASKYTEPKKKKVCKTTRKSTVMEKKTMHKFLSQYGIRSAHGKD
jgi:phosphoserine aminotransferase